jgi:hypothetical protein
VPCILDAEREDGEAVRLDLRQREEETALKVLREQLRNEQRRDARLLHPGDLHRFAGLVAFDFEDAVVVHRDDGHVFLARHLAVARGAQNSLPEGVTGAEAVRDRDVRVPTRFQVVNDAAYELGVGRAPLHAVVAAALRGVLRGVEPADVRLDEHRRLGGAERDDRLAESFAEIESRSAAQDNDW